MADKAKDNLKSLADLILGEDPTKKAASNTARAIGLGERSASRTQSSMESSIRGIERVGRQMEASSDAGAKERRDKVANDMATWIAAIQSEGTPESVGTPLDAEVAREGAEGYLKSLPKEPASGEPAAQPKASTPERVYKEGTPSFIVEGSSFRKALKEREAETYDTLFGNAERGNTPFKDVKITDMTLGEVLEFSRLNGEWHSYNKGTKNKNTTALGKYQFVGSTLRDLEKRGILEDLGITKDTKFDKDTQDAIAAYLARRRVEGKSQSAARQGLRNEWEGFKKLSDSQLDEIIAEIRKG